MSGAIFLQPRRTRQRADIPGRGDFCGIGTGPQGSRTLGGLLLYGGFGPHIGFAYSQDQKTVFRGSYARSFAPLMAVGGSTHNMGFTLTDSLSNPNNGIQPLFILSQGFPPILFRRSSILRSRTVQVFPGGKVPRRLARRQPITSTSPFNGNSAEHASGRRLQRRHREPPPGDSCLITTRTIHQC